MHATLVLALLAAQPDREDLFPKLPPPAAATAGDTPLKKLQKERFNERLKAAEKINAALRSGQVTGADFDGYVRLLLTLADNGAELEGKPADRVKWLELRIEVLKRAEKIASDRTAAGSEPAQVLHLAKAARLDAEIDLLKLKESLKPDK
jgi:hypothetical protein